MSTAPKILCTMPGRYGDILWALPTVRALSEAYGGPVDFAVSAKYGALAPLLVKQPYIDHVDVMGDWHVEEAAPMTPRVPPEALWGGPFYDRVFHLGYAGWPEGTLAADIYRRAYHQYRQQGTPDHGRYPALELDRPWITPTATATRPDRPYVWVAWSEEWFELKLGLLVALAARFPEQAFLWLRPWGGRYDEIDFTTLHATGMQHHRLGPNVEVVRADWSVTATIAAGAVCYLGCLSSQWVLANALGVKVVAVEPAEQRWHPVFWRESERNVLVRGNDGRPTFDARHVGDVLEGVLGAR